jgi:signal transduction histidine kinase
MDVTGLRIGWGLEPLSPVGETENADIEDELRRGLVGHEFRAWQQLPSAQPVAGPEPGAGMHHAHPAVTLVSVRLSDGSWLNFAARQVVSEPLWKTHFIAPLATGFLVVVALSVWAVRRAALPLGLLAAAAQRLGRDVTVAPLPVAGPREVRAAAQAFNDMQARLRRFVEDRTQMVAAISHDLRTPITRLKLRAEFIDDDEQRIKMLSDLDEMEAMISATLAFARGEAAGESRRPVDLAAMLRDLCGDFDANCEAPANLVINAGPTGIKRAFANLLENARKYGGGARVRLTPADGQVTIFIDDDGPGIPSWELERVFSPFYRLETSRNRDTGGTGLGLSVARSAVRAHGGDIVLAKRDGGGLRATVTLPA